MEQRSKEWFEMRKGRFTASRISEIMGIKGLGLTGETYAEELANELVFGRDEEEEFVSYDMMRGIQLEPIAFDKFQELKSFDFISVQKSEFFPFGENAGASPDGLVGDDAILEIKCPRPKKFFKLVAKGIDAIDKTYIHQMQMQMLCTNSQRCYFFNYIIYNGQPMWHELIIERDETTIELMKLRIEEATILRDSFMQFLINNKQF